MDESRLTGFLLKAAELLEEGLLLFFPVDKQGLFNIEGAYAAIAPNNPEDIALILHPKTFDPNVNQDDIPCDDEGEAIFFSFGKLI
jgi:hypothetical protein